MKQIRVWAKRISESDREAFNALFRYLYPRLITFAMRYTGRKSVSDDIVQEAFVTLWNRRQQIDHQKSLKAYMYRIVRNRSLNYLRDHSNEVLGLDRTEREAEAVSGPADMEQEDDKKRMKLLKSWINELPERQQEAFKLSRFEGLDHEEIAGVMEVSPYTVNNHIMHALDKLKERYEAHRAGADNETREDE